MLAANARLRLRTEHAGRRLAEEPRAYEELLPYVNHRANLTYVIGEMIGELNLATPTSAAATSRPAADPAGLLGAAPARRGLGQYYRIAKILRGENWEPQLRSPLTEIGVDVKEGEYIVAVNGRPTNESTIIYGSLVNTAGKQVTLRRQHGAPEKGSRETVVVPIADEQPLYYLNWVQRNIEKRAGHRRQGGLPAHSRHGADGLNEFVKHYYPQMNKKALIIDVRGNGGGNVSPQIVERLRREIAMIAIARNAAAERRTDGHDAGAEGLLWTSSPPPTATSWPIASRSTSSAR